MNKLGNLPELVRGGREALHSTIRTRIGLVMVLLGAGVLVAGCLTLAVAVEYFFRSGVPLTSEEEASKPTVEISLPTQECPPEGLRLGERAFAVQAVSLSSEGLLPAAPTEAGLAYRVEGTGEVWVFLLGMEAFGGDAAALGSLTQVTYSDGKCNSFVYQLSPAQPVQLNRASAAGFPQAELAVLIQSGADGSGVALYSGAMAVEETSPQEAPTPEASLALFEIKVLAVRPSDVAQIVQVKVSIYNSSAQALELNAEEVSLLVESGSALGPLSAKPALPETIRTGETAEIEIIFPKPAQGLGRLRVFTVELELAGFAE